MSEKSYIRRFFGHFKTITHHRHLVMGLCFRCGLYKQGLLHDLSKYHPAEFLPGVKYWTGTRSPIYYERKEIGYSTAWAHHKGHNYHHWQYWTDNQGDEFKLEAMQMPANYFIESVLDRIAACKNYNGSNYTDKDALNYHLNSKERLGMHPEDDKRLTICLTYLAENGEKKALKYYKSLYKEFKKTGTTSLHQH